MCSKQLVFNVFLNRFISLELRSVNLWLEKDMLRRISWKPVNLFFLYLHFFILKTYSHKLCLLFCKKMPNFLFPVPFFPMPYVSGPYALWIKRTILIELSQLSQCGLFEFLQLSFLLIMKSIEIKKLWS